MKGQQTVGQKTWNGTIWSDTAHPRLPGDVSFSSAVSALLDNRQSIFLYAIGQDGVLYARQQIKGVWEPDNSWGYWNRNRGFVGPPAPLAIEQRYNGVYIRTFDGEIQQLDGLVTDGVQIISENLQFASLPVGVATLNKRADILALGADTKLKHISWITETHAWSGWTDINDTGLGNYEIRSSPSVVSTTLGRLDAFILVGEQHVAHAVYKDRAWHGWQILGNHSFTSSPVAVAITGTNKTDLWGLGSDHAYWHRQTPNGDDWLVDWDSHLGNFTSAPALVSSCEEVVDIFGINGNQHIQHARWNGTDRSWKPSYQHWRDLGGSFHSF